MRIYDLLSSDSRRIVESMFGNINLHSGTNKRSKRNSECLSDMELKELMGENRQIHKRVNGRVRRK